MKKILAATAFVVACLAPLTTVRAQITNLNYSPFCTTGLTINFCGSVLVSATASSSGTDITMTVLNYSGGVYGGDPSAVFTSIGLLNVNDPGTLTLTSVVGPGGDFTSHWTVATDKNNGIQLVVDASTIPGSTINYGISSACAAAPGDPDPDASKRIFTGGAGSGPCSPQAVIISFHATATNFSVAGGNVFVKQQGALSSHCILGTDCSYTPPTTTVPEPASIVLVGTGLMALGRRASNWRRRNRNV